MSAYGRAEYLDGSLKEYREQGAGIYDLRFNEGDLTSVIRLLWIDAKAWIKCSPYFALPRVDDRRVLSGIIFLDRNGLRWRDGPYKTLYSR